MGIFANNSERKLLESKMKEEGRLPPGQVATFKWTEPVYGEIRRLDALRGPFRTRGWVAAPLCPQPP